ncbi:unnamed protein product [Echinostoma caproni]|uniref:TORC_M domain-containing protein n=1 Tax=Echinostoma caproni TaxID=27848 RepID=A0A183AVF2_9TREM|nr:unnamed protein product [Echinostoma caproni]
MSPLDLNSLEKPPSTPLLSDNSAVNRSDTELTPINPMLSSTFTQPNTDILPPPISSLHNPPDVSISGYQGISGPERTSQLPTTYPYPDSNQYPSVYDTSGHDRRPYTWSNHRYSVDLNSGSIQEQLDTQDQWWPTSYQSQP